MSDLLVPPHGGQLKPLLLEGDKLNNAITEAKKYPQVRLTSRETSDLIMLAIGAFSPLDGFMREKDYLGVVNNMEMSDGTLWPIPITLSVEKELADTLDIGDKAALVDDESGELMGALTIEEKYTYDKKVEALKVFGTKDEAHPGVAKVYAQHDILLAGPVFSKKGWRTISGFQTRTPIHRSHEYVTKIAMEVTDGVLIHPLVGKLKAGDIPADIRMKCYEILIENYYPKDNVVLKVYPMEMRYGGPREAVLHAIFRQNYGCSHLIIGRDHAGVGNYYGPFDAQKIFNDIPDDKLHIKPLNIDWTFWCHKCDGMASMKTCPHDKDDRVMISGTKLREMLAEGQLPPKEFSRPEVADILMKYYQSL
ncbi:MAG: sulfate adenylyltransferase [Calditrichaceae bacterium]